MTKTVTMGQNLYIVWDGVGWRDAYSGEVLWRSASAPASAPKTTRTCPDCHGTRVYVGLYTAEPCQLCAGTGVIKAKIITALRDLIDALESTDTDTLAPRDWDAELAALGDYRWDPPKPGIGWSVARADCVIIPACECFFKYHYEARSEHPLVAALVDEREAERQAQLRKDNGQ